MTNFKIEERLPKCPKGECNNITFMEVDLRWVHHLYNNPLVISLVFENMMVRRSLVDNGSSVNI